MQIETSIGLPGGWHYEDAAGYRIPLRGELPSAQSVIDALMQHRLENNIPVGDPQADMENFVCSRFPTYCRPKTPTLPPARPHGTRNVDIVTEWANALYVNVGRLALVPAREAQARSETCVRCPMQMSWAEDCPPCVTSAQRLLMILRQGKDVPLGPSGTLNGCACHGWDNRTAVWFDRAHLPPKANPGAPEMCWVNP
jgi:hypothetical protein